MDEQEHGPGSPEVVPLLEGIRIVDLAGEPAAATGRILAELGASVTRVVPSDGDPLADPTTGDPHRAMVWTAGKLVVRLAADAPALGILLARADLVIDTPGWPGAPELEPSAAPGASWVRLTPFGLDGPRARWRASDLGVMAASGNMWCTGDSDRAPLRCAEPTAYAHAAAEAALAALSALASGRRQIVDVSMQEAVLVANMGGPGRFFREGDRGQRRGARIGRTREVWPCADGFVSFGIRGGKARVRTWETISRLVAEDGIEAPGLADRDWASFSHTTATQEELDGIATPLGEYFSRHTVAELYRLACEHNLTLAPINSPREIVASPQLAVRRFLGPLGGEGLGGEGDVPRRFARIVVREGAPADAASPSEVAEADPPTGPAGAWDGTRLLELGSGAAGPIATRYFAEHGATVVRVESRKRPDFLRAYALGPRNPHGLDAAPMFDALNVGKLSLAIDLKDPRGREVALGLVDWADALSENFAPKAMANLGLDYETLAQRKPDLVMVSACLNGQTGPRKDYPGFGSQGAALAGFNYLTGWPDREPVGPYGTITDSIAPRFVATALAAGLLHRRRTGRGCYVDLSQVETGIWCLSPWLARYAATGEVVARMGNRSERACPHGAFPCRGEDRWIALAAWTDEEWESLADELGIHEPDLASSRARHATPDRVEALVAEQTAGHDAAALSERLQARGVEAVPVMDFGNVHDDPQLTHRGHLVTLEHPRLGPGHYERNGFRLSEAPAGYRAPSPLLGEHNRLVLGEILGMDDADIDRLEADGVLE